MDKKTFLDYVEFYGMFGERLFDAFDTKKNKLIDLEEFMTGIARFLNGSMSEKIQLLFKMFDLRADGQVSLEELRTMLYSMLKHKELYTSVSRQASYAAEEEPKSGLGKILEALIEKTQDLAKTSALTIEVNAKAQGDEKASRILLNGAGAPKSPTKTKEFVEAEKIDEYVKSAHIEPQDPEEDESNTAEDIIDHTLSVYAKGKTFLTFTEFQNWVLGTPQILEFMEIQLRSHVFKKGDKPKAGYLSKRGKTFNGLVKRYCVVQDGFLYQFHNDKQVASGTPGNAIFLKGLRIKEPTSKIEKVAFGIRLESDEMSRTLYARDAAERKQWMQWLTLESKHESIEDEYKTLNKVGEGRFANVFRCQHKKTGRFYAVKVIDKMEVDDSDKEGLRAEIAILRLCSHPFIVSMKKVYETKENIYIVMEWMEHGDLFKEICRQKFFPEEVARHVIQQLCSAIRYCHLRGIVHKDIKPENLLVERLENSYIRIYVTDFGLSQFAKPAEGLKDAAGSVAYMAPEMIDSDTFDKSVDVWGIGVIAYVLLCGGLPFFDRDEIELMNKIVSKPVTFTSKRWDKVSKEAQDFIKKLLEKNPKKRLTIEQAMAHPWMSTINDLVPLARIKSGIMKNDVKSGPPETILEEGKDSKEVKKEEKEPESSQAKKVSEAKELEVKKQEAKELEAQEPQAKKATTQKTEPVTSANVASDVA